MRYFYVWNGLQTLFNNSYYYQSRQKGLANTIHDLLDKSLKPENDWGATIIDEEERKLKNDDIGKVEYTKENLKLRLKDGLIEFMIDQTYSMHRDACHRSKTYETPNVTPLISKLKTFFDRRDIKAEFERFVNYCIQDCMEYTQDYVTTTRGNYMYSRFVYYIISRMAFVVVSNLFILPFRAGGDGNNNSNINYCFNDLTEYLEILWNFSVYVACFPNHRRPKNLIQGENEESFYLKQYRLLKNTLFDSSNTDEKKDKDNDKESDDKNVSLVSYFNDLRVFDYTIESHFNGGTLLQSKVQTTIVVLLTLKITITIIIQVPVTKD